MKKTKKFYVVWRGRQPGVYESWEKCNAEIHGFKDAIYKSFNTHESAIEAFKNDAKDYIGQNVWVSELSSEELDKIGNPIRASICVDGAWNTDTGVIEYKGVNFSDGKILFHAGPFNHGTNNIAEFLAIVHALAYCNLHKLFLPIYSDSQNAISWVKRKKANTKIAVNTETESVRNLITRAENWLNTNEYSNLILKWRTDAWGENPADFGRK